MAEGRIVMAGTLADAGDLRGALALLAGQERQPPRVRPYHLRQWYVIADLYDRAGEVPRARALFQRIRQLEPEFATSTPGSRHSVADGATPGDATATHPFTYAADADFPPVHPPSQEVGR